MKKFLVTFLLLTASALGQSPKVEALAHAIAKAEGFYVKGSLPNRLHNPGDIRATGIYYPGQIGRNKNGYAIFADDSSGFAVLHRQIQRIADGQSQYSMHLTFAAFARRYVGGPGWVEWTRIVTRALAVTPGTTLEYYLECPPALAYQKKPLDFFVSI